MTKEDVAKWSNWIAQWDDDPELQLDPDCELAAAYGQIQKLEAEKKELEENLQVFERQWLLYKQKSDSAIEEILKLRRELSKLEKNIEDGDIQLKLRIQQVEELRDERTDLQEALDWYTDRKNLEKYIGTSEHHSNDERWFNCWMMSPVTDKARKALGMKTETEELLNGRQGIHSGNTG